ncbi:MAG: S1 RNA-binding domain-containing protein [Anaerolineales bacterium]|nr:S1 RNA-binding domain-containing protein [Anaerolineales bacterium]
MDTNASVAQESTGSVSLADLKRKTKFTGTVVKTTLAGAIVDIGLGTPGVIHISQLQAEPTNRVEDVVKVGQTVEVWVRRVDPKKDRIELTMVEPLNLEWREITKGMVVQGKVSRLEKFGAFVEIGAERPGLVHVSEMTHGYIKSPGDILHEGDDVEVQVLEVNRRKKQIKLSMKALEEKPKKPGKPAAEKETPEVKEAPVPTAMEIALREAMERSNAKITAAKPRSKAKGSTADNEIEQILTRTLKNKVRTGN